MNHYELLAIVNGRFADAEVDTVIASVKDLLKKYDCPIHYVQPLERRRLAYPIQHSVYGTYVLMEFDAEKKSIQHLEKDLLYAHELLRHCIVKRDTVGKPKELEKKERIEREVERVIANEHIEEEKAAPKEEDSKPTDDRISKKKDKELSLEDFDKKLDDILNNTIL